MLSNRGVPPLRYPRLPRSKISALAGVELDPNQVEQYLGSIQDIQAAVLRGPAHAVTGIEAGGKLIGFYILHPDRRDNACWWLGWFALDRHQQGRGYGRIALARIMSVLRRVVGCRRVRLLVDSDNSRALHLYTQAGFTAVGRNGAGEIILEIAISVVAVIEDIIALLRASSVSKRARRAGRLRLSPGPHAGLVMGVERGPPCLAA